MGTLTPTGATMHCKLRSGSVETPKPVNVVHCASVSNSSLGIGSCSFVRNAVYGVVLHPAKQLLCVRNNNYKIFSTPVNQANEKEELETEVDEVRNIASYLFHTEGGGLVKVSVGRKSSDYVVIIKVSAMQLDMRKLSLNRMVSNLPIDFEGFTTGGKSKSKPKENIFKHQSSVSFTLDQEFSANGAPPFNLSFFSTRFKQFSNQEP